MWDTIKYTNIYLMGIPKKKEERKKGTEIIFEEIMAENFPNLMENVALHIQKNEINSNWINSKRSMVEVLKDKEKIWKATRGK